MRKLWRPLGLCLVPALSGCGFITESIQQLSRASVPDKVFFKSSAPRRFHNQTAFEFEWEKSRGASQYVVKLFETADCSGPARSPVVWLDSTFSVAGLQNGQTYSVLVAASNDVGMGAWTCSDPVTIDLDLPTINLSQPLVSTLVGNNHFLFEWNAFDVGASGLREGPELFQVEVFSQSGCSGSILQTVSTPFSQFDLSSMSPGVPYSVRVQTRDRAENVSVAVCSASVTFDSSSPNLSITDPGTGSGAYALQQNINVSIGNDPYATRWCLSETQSTPPASGSANCVGGAGASNGWQTSRPSSFQLSGGDGPKTVYLWVANASGLILGAGSVSDSILLNLTTPVVSFVTSTTNDGTYGTGSVINVNVQFSEPVLWNGTVTLQLETGDSDVALSGTFSGASDLLSFSYVVLDNHVSSDLNYLSSASLVLTSGTANDGAGRDAVFTLPIPASAQSLGGQKNLVVQDIQSPSAPTGWTMAPTSGSFSNDTTPTITVPAISTEGGSAVRIYADAGCSTLLFGPATISSSNPVNFVPVTYPSDGSQDGLKSYFGQVTDSSGNVGTCGPVATYTLDTIPPTVLSVSTTRANGKYLRGAQLDIRVHWSENVFATVGPRILTNLSPTTYAGIQAGSSGTAISVFLASVPSNVVSNADFGYMNSNALESNGGTLRDLAGNNAIRTLPLPGGGVALQDLAAIEVLTDSGMRLQMISDSDGATFPRIDDANPVTITADGTQAYLVSAGFIYHFTRNSSTGVLAYANRVNTGVTFQTTSISISPESPAKNLYFAGGPTSTSRVQVYNIHPSTGDLTLAQTFPMDTATANPCVGASRNQVTPDGNYFVLSCIWSNSISFFQRNSGDGVITLLGQYTSLSTGFPEISEPRLLGISSDSKFLYFAGRNGAGTQGRLMTFELDPGTSALIHRQTIEPYAILRTGLDSSKMVFSPLNNWVYVPGGATTNNRITQFSRDPVTGALSEIGFTATSHVDSLEISGDGRNVYYLTADFHGRNHWFFHMSANPTTGALSQVLQYTSGTANNWALDFTSGLTTGPDGTSLYVTGKNNAAISHYSIATPAGTLSRVSTLVSGSGSGLEFMGWLGGVVADLTNSFLYVFSNGDSAVNIFDRSATTGALNWNRTYVQGRDLQGASHAKAGIIDSTNGYLMTCGWRNVATRFYSGTATVSSFARNTATGELTHISTYSGNSSRECVSLSLSPDDRFLYVHVAGGGMDIYEKNPSTGGLTFVSAFNVVGGSQQRFSKDMKHLYSIIPGTHSISIYERHIVTGIPSLIGTVTSLAGGVGCLQAPVSLVPSPDGQSIYVSYSGTSGVCAAGMASFSRDPVTGLLTFVRTEIEHGQNFISFSPGGGDTWMEIDPSGDTLVHKVGDSDTRIFQINSSDGSLRFAGSLAFCNYNRYYASIAFNPNLRQFTCTSAPDWEPLPGNIQVISLPSW